MVLSSTNMIEIHFDLGRVLQRIYKFFKISTELSFMISLDLRVVKVERSYNMKKFLIGLLVVGVIVLGVGTSCVAYAQDAPNSTKADGNGPQNDSPPSTQAYAPGPRDGDPGPIHELLIGEMAEALGMTADQLQARLDAGETMRDIAADAGYEGEDLFTLMSEVHEKVINQALDDGLITEEQAERMRERGGRFGRRSGGPDGRRGDGRLSEYFHAALAEGLGITVADLEARIDAGETLRQIAEDLGIGTEDLPGLMQTARDEAIEQALADGAITQEQYDRIQQHSQNRPKGNQTQFGPGGSPPRRYGPAGGQPGH
jgi:hypothetical protein